MESLKDLPKKIGDGTKKFGEGTKKIGESIFDGTKKIGEMTLSGTRRQSRTGLQRTGLSRVLRIDEGNGHSMSSVRGINNTQSNASASTAGKSRNVSQNRTEVGSMVNRNAATNTDWDRKNPPGRPKPPAKPPPPKVVASSDYELKLLKGDILDFEQDITEEIKELAVSERNRLLSKLKDVNHSMLSYQISLNENFPLVDSLNDLHDLGTSPRVSTLSSVKRHLKRSSSAQVQFPRLSATFHSNRHNKDTDWVEKEQARRRPSLQLPRRGSLLTDDTIAQTGLSLAPRDSMLLRGPWGSPKSRPRASSATAVKGGEARSVVDTGAVAQPVPYQPTHDFPRKRHSFDGLRDGNKTGATPQTEFSTTPYAKDIGNESIPNAAGDIFDKREVESGPRNVSEDGDRTKYAHNGAGAESKSSPLSQPLSSPVYRFEGKEDNVSAFAEEQVESWGLADTEARESGSLDSKVLDLPESDGDDKMFSDLGETSEQTNEAKPDDVRDTSDQGSLDSVILHSSPGTSAQHPEDVCSSGPPRFTVEIQDSKGDLCKEQMADHQTPDIGGTIPSDLNTSDSGSVNSVRSNKPMPPKPYARGHARATAEGTKDVPITQTQQQKQEAAIPNRLQRTKSPTPGSYRRISGSEKTPPSNTDGPPSPNMSYRMPATVKPHNSHSARLSKQLRQAEIRIKMLELYARSLVLKNVDLEFQMKDLKEVDMTEIFTTKDGALIMSEVYTASPTVSRTVTEMQPASSTHSIVDFQYDSDTVGSNSTAELNGQSSDPKTASKSLLSPRGGAESVDSLSSGRRSRVDSVASTSMYVTPVSSILSNMYATPGLTPVATVDGLSVDASVDAKQSRSSDKISVSGMLNGAVEELGPGDDISDKTVCTCRKNTTYSRPKPDSRRGTGTAQSQANDQSSSLISSQASLRVLQAHPGLQLTSRTNSVMSSPGSHSHSNDTLYFDALHNTSTSDLLKLNADVQELFDNGDLDNVLHGMEIIKTAKQNLDTIDNDRKDLEINNKTTAVREEPDKMGLVAAIKQLAAKNRSTRSNEEKKFGTANPADDDARARDESSNIKSAKGGETSQDMHSDINKINLNSEVTAVSSAMKLLYGLNPFSTRASGSKDGSEKKSRESSAASSNDNLQKYIRTDKNAIPNTEKASIPPASAGIAKGSSVDTVEVDNKQLDKRTSDLTLPCPGVKLVVTPIGFDDEPNSKDVVEKNLYKSADADPDTRERERQGPRTEARETSNATVGVVQPASSRQRKNASTASDYFDEDGFVCMYNGVQPDPLQVLAQSQDATMHSPELSPLLSAEKSQAKAPQLDATHVTSAGSSDGPGTAFAKPLAHIESLRTKTRHVVPIASHLAVVSVPGATGGTSDGPTYETEGTDAGTDLVPHATEPTESETGGLVDQHKPITGEVCMLSVAAAGAQGSLDTQPSKVPAQPQGWTLIKSPPDTQIESSPPPQIQPPQQTHLEAHSPLETDAHTPPRTEAETLAQVSGIDDKPVVDLDNMLDDRPEDSASGVEVESWERLDTIMIKYKATMASKLPMPESILKKPGQRRKGDCRKDPVQFNPLTVWLDAALYGDIETCNSMIASDVDVDWANNDGLTALHNACCGGHCDIALLLLESGANPNCRDVDGWTPLHGAAAFEDEPVIECLLHYGAVINIENSDGDTPISLAEHENIKRLLENHDAKKHSCDYARAAFAYTPQNSDELALEIGEIVEVDHSKNESADWWWVTKYGMNIQGFACSRFLIAINIGDLPYPKQSEGVLSETTRFQENLPQELGD
ncbi:hypothetical protein SARC_03152 [Sphaeroforma arctica JP610]|uniref:SH3 domain-containing protein n=1 Tax=Sphaeroforma arctica JP610 TaxID=667725 RepID=A0A0L0G6J9_9EUKA|nr:hypothetical protein SARC_03152 [Sphaeroforma arctica JP610]KNC84622.1 hypothetical protein SARC_03152 [Sphaeroforma arctica JP610]|eukprot:XP_014158524.1 hypothetical protein SARC_03152 [Sphaeroforma arctica JP610]